MSVKHITGHTFQNSIMNYDDMLIKKDDLYMLEIDNDMRYTKHISMHLEIDNVTTYTKYICMQIINKATSGTKRSYYKHICLNVHVRNITPTGISPAR